MSQIPPASAKVSRPFDSSRTRVGPIFGALSAATTGDPQWLRTLLDLAADGPGARPWHTQDLSVAATDRFHAPGPGAKVPKERGLHPPVALLSWLLRNFPRTEAEAAGKDDVARKRQALARRDPAFIAEGLAALRRSRRGWHILEGATYPDAYFKTPDALIVVEGKRTERTIATETQWMPRRHQIWRHLDAAWEIAGPRAVYGIMIVESQPGSLQVPAKWVTAARATREEASVLGSLPHRGPDEQAGIRNAFVGVTTWAQVVSAFGLPTTLLE